MLDNWNSTPTRWWYQESNFAFVKGCVNDHQYFRLVMLFSKLSFSRHYDLPARATDQRSVSQHSAIKSSPPAVNRISFRTNSTFERLRQMSIPLCSTFRIDRTEEEDFERRS